jgi:hypothetical protein
MEFICDACQCRMDSICRREYLTAAPQQRQFCERPPVPWGRAMGALQMLDIVYLLIGAVFLGGCVLYAIACDHL